MREYVHICSFLNGALPFNQLVNMPFAQYKVLKRAVEIESIHQRMIRLQDTANAFGDPKKLMESLKKDYLSLVNRNSSENPNSISWGKDPDWKRKLKELQR